MSTCCAFFEGYGREAKCVETYIDHVDRAIKVWHTIKPYYYRSVIRALGVSLNFDPVEFGLLMHDFGKLMNAYSRNHLNYRHEILSAYATYKVLSEMNVDRDAARIIALAVMLHHEPIIMASHVVRYGERYLTLTSIRAMLESERENLDISCSLDDVGRYIKRYDYGNHITKILKTFEGNVVDIEDIISTLRGLITWATVGDTGTLHVRRAKVAALLHPLVVSDSIAAFLSRNKCRENIKGQQGEKTTHVVRRALNLDNLGEKAELIPTLTLNELIRSVCGGEHE